MDLPDDVGQVPSFRIWTGVSGVLGFIFAAVDLGVARRRPPSGEMGEMNG